MLHLTLCMACIFMGIFWFQTMHGGPLYIAETCPVDIRGTLISTKEALIVCGMLVSFCRSLRNFVFYFSKSEFFIFLHKPDFLFCFDSLGMSLAS